jgi:hypothetical protein
MKAETTTLLSHQEIFDRAAMHLLQRGRASLFRRGGGAYRGYAGWCRVGNRNLIQPRDYNTLSKGAHSLSHQSTERNSGVMNAGVVR